MKIMRPSNITQSFCCGILHYIEIDNLTTEKNKPLLLGFVIDLINTGKAKSNRRKI
ncbi:hypothetical protein [Alkaliphilus peptidifermentans]|uniref:Uncharacterized protein n=1 Tax=Alkaliphilus peptidifermentans DSM 18978 TaxID=1120976 RepID=A0A1G5GIA7_9FIRM|nr:hypothetical protein [Alkaliphilus peptidifermentans]SCY51273.1 hypothetical protein SAMN03080606_01701 [Alkaliphilus peptidifermentans DSM 18978]